MNVLCLLMGHKWCRKGFFAKTGPGSATLWARCMRCGYQGPKRSSLWVALYWRYLRIPLLRLRRLASRRTSPSEHRGA